MLNPTWVTAIGLIVGGGAGGERSFVSVFLCLCLCEMLRGGECIMSGRVGEKHLRPHVDTCTRTHAFSLFHPSLLFLSNVNERQNRSSHRED